MERLTHSNEGPFSSGQLLVGAELQLGQRRLSGGGSSSLTVQDEGSALSTTTTLNFVGSGVTASGTGTKTIQSLVEVVHF